MTVGNISLLGSRIGTGRIRQEMGKQGRRTGTGGAGEVVYAARGYCSMSGRARRIVNSWTRPFNGGGLECRRNENKWKAEVKKSKAGACWPRRYCRVYAGQYPLPGRKCRKYRLDVFSNASASLLQVPSVKLALRMEEHYRKIRLTDSAIVAGMICMMETVPWSVGEGEQEACQTIRIPVRNVWRGRVKEENRHDKLCYVAARSRLFGLAPVAIRGLESSCRREMASGICSGPITAISSCHLVHCCIFP